MRPMKWSDAVPGTLFLCRHLDWIGDGRESVLLLSIAGMPDGGLEALVLENDASVMRFTVMPHDVIDRTAIWDVLLP